MSRDSATGTGTIRPVSALSAELSVRGIAIIPKFLDVETTRKISRALALQIPPEVPAKRNLFDFPLVRALAGSGGVGKLAQEVLGPPCFAVRALYFDKTSQANWAVPWHQDLAIAVKARIDTPGYDNWTVKGGVQHVQAPTHVLSRMVAVRLHIDPCDHTNGALLVIPGSHDAGRIPETEIAKWVGRHKALPCIVPRGSAILLKPQLLHSSPKTQSNSRRRVLHIEYASVELDGGLKWHQRHPAEA